MDKSVIVVIPVYKTKPDPSEERAIVGINKVLVMYKRVFIAPDTLDMNAYTDLCNIDSIRFPAHYFEGLKGYNQLMLSHEFYSAFAEFEYMLIAQPDTWIFSDKLDYWCMQGYDYIGAPWMGDWFRIFLNIGLKQSWPMAFYSLLSGRLQNAVGNGGLSLRRLNPFLQVTSEFPDLPEIWKANEDYFWGLFARVDGKRLNIPKYRMAAKFSMELNPKYCMRLNQGELPFGLHAWEKHHPAFWANYITQ